MGWGTEFFARKGSGYTVMMLHGGFWLGLAFCVAAGSTVTSWIELRNQAVANNIPFHLDWLDWSKGVFFVGAACFTALRTFTDQSVAQYRQSHGTPTAAGPPASP